jgi:hypothetical protein
LRRQRPSSARPSSCWLRTPWLAGDGLGRERGGAGEGCRRRRRKDGVVVWCRGGLSLPSRNLLYLDSSTQIAVSYWASSCYCKAKRGVIVMGRPFVPQLLATRPPNTNTAKVTSWW